MESDCCVHVRKCHKCQTFADNVNAPPVPLNVLATPWPFSMWGIDVIKAIEPKASNGHRFILVAIDYFTKWVEATSYASVTRNVVIRFIKKEIICWYGLPKKIITNNATNLNNKMMKEMCEDFKIQHHNFTPYQPKINGAVEAANKNIKKIVQKMIVSYKDWHEMLPFALHGYRTFVRSSTRATPFSLVYKMEVMLSFEVEVPSLRILAESGLEELKWAQARFDQLNLIEGKRLATMSHGRLYQSRVKNTFDKRVCLHKFSEEDLVLKKVSQVQKDHRIRLSREEHCCLWTWMAKSCLRLWIPTSSGGITSDAWGNLKTQCLGFLKDSFGSLSLKIFVNHNHNINKYGLMICISPSSVVSFTFYCL